MSQSMFFLVFLFFFFLIKSNADEDSSRDAAQYCPSSTCKNGTINLSYPFWKVDDSSPTACGYPGFGINCSNPDPNFPILYLSDDTFLVKNINYTDHSITLVDADVTSNKKCPRPRHNFTLPGKSPLAYSGRDLNLTFYFNCTNHVADAYPVYCFSSEQYTSYLYAGATNPYHSDWFRFCEDKVETTVMEIEGFVNDEGWWKPWNRHFGGVMNNGFVLNWRESEECGLCESSNGLCGQDKHSGQFLCFCGSGTETNDHCRLSQGDKVTLGAKICIGIGGVALCVVVFCIIFCAYLRGKKRYPSGNKLDMQGSGNCSGKKEEKIKKGNLEVFMEQYGSLAPMIYTYSDIKK